MGRWRSLHRPRDGGAADGTAVDVAATTPTTPLQEHKNGSVEVAAIPALPTTNGCGKKDKDANGTWHGAGDGVTDPLNPVTGKQAGPAAGGMGNRRESASPAAAAAKAVAAVAAVAPSGAGRTPLDF